METVFWNYEGKEYFFHEQALAELLQADILFCNEREYLDENGKTSGERTIVLFVICNDIFAWACADCEALPYDQIIVLYKMYKADKWGTDKWCCIQRNIQPQGPVVEAMKKDGSWDETMENLPKNWDNKEIK